ncbi:MAG TPA: phenylalanine--tRNA ligase subunit beta [Bacilli bacterium]|nr:phenylalanine--tRNA ligase subunit beta [Bacilli bacterium]
MKLSMNFLRDYVDIKDSAKVVAEAMAKIGNDYETVSKLVPVEGLVTGYVESCEMHPDSDHLHVCKVNIGKEVLTIVCGAPNVNEGIKVIVAPSGTVLPVGTIKKVNIRGIESNGMICALEEIGIESKYISTEEKKGIHILPDAIKVGTDPIKELELDDEVIDFDLCANRGDLLSVMGLAFEIGTIYSKNVKEMPIDYKDVNDNVKKYLDIDIKTENCSLFLAKKVVDIEIKESPSFIKNRLIASGIRPINNVVDISNYVMLETGQPLHFYDAEKLGNKLVVRMAKEKETVITLDNIKRNLTGDDIVIANDKEPIGLAGVMGGLSTEVDYSTKNIVIEAAIFDPIKVRYTSKKILRSEASARFEKGLDAKRTYFAIERACYLLEKYAGAKVLSGLVEYNNCNSKDRVMEISLEKINKILGFNIKKEEVVNIFKRLKFSVKEENDVFRVIVPSRRVDISTYNEELIEEVSRIYGVDNVIGRLPSVPIKPGNYDKKLRDIKSKMVSLGLSETLTYTLIDINDVNKFTSDKFKPVRLESPINDERNTLRYSLIFSLMKVIEYNFARNIKDLCLFEIGKGFFQKDDEYGEENKLAIALTGEYFSSVDGSINVDFYIAKGIAEELLEYLGYENRYSFNLENIPSEFNENESARIYIDGNPIGYIGLIKGYKEKIYAIEINLDILFKNKISKTKYKEISKYPSVSKDIAVITKKDIYSEQIEKQIRKSGGSLLKDIKVFDVYEGEKVEKDERSIAYTLTFSDYTRTLSDEEVLKVFNKIIVDIEKELNVKVRSK